MQNQTRSLATEDEIESIWAIYVQYFEDSSDNAETVAITVPTEVQAGIEAWFTLQDLGVEKFAKNTLAELETLLAWPGSQPPIFAEYRSQAGRNEWNSNETFSKENLDTQPLALLWHQMCGVAAMVDKLWSADEGKLPGILLADAVGIGKTAQIMAVIAMSIQIWIAEQQGREGKSEVRPPILGKLEIGSLTVELNHSHS